MKQKAFTTIELIVMITLLAIILALIVPNFLTYLDNSSEREYEATRESIERAAELYIEKNGGFDNDLSALTLETLEEEGYIGDETTKSLTRYNNSGLSGYEGSGDYATTICVDPIEKKVIYKIEGCE